MTSAKGTAELAGLPYALLWEAGVQGEADGGAQIRVLGERKKRILRVRGVCRSRGFAQE